ncbi:MAG: hypothetical protein ACR2F9_04155 [Longimicrobiaceae bacterium]
MAELRLLLRLDALRLRRLLTRPALAVTAALATAAWLAAVGLAAAPAPHADAEQRVGAGVLLAALPALAAYGVLFRPADDAFLRRLGVGARALYAHRTLRLLCCTLLPVPFVSSFGAWGAPAIGLAGATAGAVAAWGAATSTFVSAAAAVHAASGRPAWWQGLVAWDVELSRTAPLIYAPLFPLLAGGIAAAVVASAPLGGVALVAAVAAVLVARSAHTFARVLPRFAPHAAELAYADDARRAGTTLTIGGGVARLLPRRIAAVLARDSAAAIRRRRASVRAAWPVAAFGVLALARGGADPAVRWGVAAAAAAVLLLQAWAFVDLGRRERERRRWIDRAAGVARGHRWTGRWLAAAALSLLVTGPLALAWAVWVPAPGTWLWPLAGVALAALAGTASLLVAGR